MILLARLLVALGFDLRCICGHLYSEHDFDEICWTGLCQSGDYRTGCDCMRYEPKATRQIDRDRGTGM